MPETLLPKFALVNDEAGDDQPVPVTDLARMLGGNFARFAGLDWDLDATVTQIGELEDHWRSIWTAKSPERR